MILKLRTRTLDLAQPQVMGILNLTPDSFSDGGRYAGTGAALARVDAMLAEGATLIDVGGESTRPSAEPVAESEELDRVVPIIERIRAEFDCVVSVDTMKPAVMAAACAAGAELINDVNALRVADALAVAANSGAAICLMHMRGEPRSMQHDPQYRDVVVEVCDFLAERVAACTAAGIAGDRILLDPGFGFGKLFEHNMTLLARLEQLNSLVLPLLVGVSRKRMLGHLGDLPVDQRLAPGLAAATIAVLKGARVIRTHDVAETVAAVRFAAAIDRLTA